MPSTAPPSVLTIDVEHVGAAVVVHCHGRLVYGATNVLSSAVADLIPSTKRIILDLSDVEHTDSMGIGTLVRLYVSAKSAGCSLELINLSKQVRNLLGLTGLFSIFTVIGENGIKIM
jgi:anti-sigma B factor antagonist